MPTQLEVTRQMVRTLLAADGFVPTRVVGSSLAQEEYWQKGEALCILGTKSSTVECSAPHGIKEARQLSTMRWELPQQLQEILAWVKQHS